MKRYKPIVLINVDGWGLSKKTENNAITVAATPNIDSYIKKYPHTELTTAGPAVGLAEGIPGNSEVGHLNLGAGRIVYSELTRINQSIQDGTFFKNPILLDAFHRVKSQKTKLHLIGLLSDGGIHSHINHLYALLTLAKQYELKKVFVHAIMDGRNVPPKAGMQSIESAEFKMKELGVGKIATVIGRYYAMDRNQEWNRVHQTYDMLIYGKGIMFTHPTSAVKYAYKHKETDEFITPSIITNRNQEPVATIEDGDMVLFFNFRGDRCIELLTCLSAPEFTHFKREKVPQAEYITMTAYDAPLPITPIFLKQNMTNTLGEVLSQHKLTQLRIAETERFAQVTYFFNGMQETPFPNEERCLIPSPKIESYALKPEMSAIPVTEEVCNRIQSGNYDFILLTYANPALVAHTGSFEATKKAVEVVDECVGKVVETTLAQNGLVLITSSQNSIGNLKSPISNLKSEMDSSLVPFILIGYDKPIKLQLGILADVAPTILELLNILQPAEMTGKPII